jgi:hypothetical protein
LNERFNAVQMVCDLLLDFLDRHLAVAF